MGRRLLRASIAVTIIVAVGGAMFALARKLMGGFGPQPGSEQAPREWPSLVPEPTDEVHGEPSSNGSSGRTAGATSD